MGALEIERLSIEEVPATDDQVYEHLDGLCLELFGIPASEFIEGIREGRMLDHPAAARLGVLAEAFIER
jgi:hypothetical protein